MDSNTNLKPTQRLDESLLSHIPAFSRLQKAQLREVLDQATCKRYDAGVAVFDEGAQADRFYMLLDGVIEVMRIGPLGERVISLHIPPGQLFGIAKALGHVTYPASAITTVESIGLSWPTILWDEYVAKYEGFATES